MTEVDKIKPYGIRVELPENDPLSAGHLLGDSWASARWFETREQRDAVLESMRNQPGNYRKGDIPSVKYSLINPD